mgnify:CR=1 FL=1
MSLSRRGHHCDDELLALWNGDPVDSGGTGLAAEGPVGDGPCGHRGHGQPASLCESPAASYPGAERQTVQVVLGLHNPNGYAQPDEKAADAHVNIGLAERCHDVICFQVHTVRKRPYFLSLKYQLTMVCT